MVNVTIYSSTMDPMGKENMGNTVIFVIFYDLLMKVMKVEKLNAINIYRKERTSHIITIDS